MTTLQHADGSSATDDPANPSASHEVMLTTVDNPYNPFTHFDEWYEFDHSQGYYTLELLARVSSNSDELSEADQDYVDDTAIDEIVYYNVSGMHRKITADEEFLPSNFVEAEDTTLE